MRVRLTNDCFYCAEYNGSKIKKQEWIKISETLKRFTPERNASALPLSKPDCREKTIYFLVSRSFAHQNDNIIIDSPFVAIIFFFFFTKRWENVHGSKDCPPTAI